MAAQLRAVREAGALKEINVQSGQSSVFKYALDDGMGLDLDPLSFQSTAATMSHQSVQNLLTDAEGRSLLQPLLVMKTQARDAVWQALDQQRLAKPRFTHKPLTQEVIDTILALPCKATKFTLNSGIRTRYLYLQSQDLALAVAQHSVRPFLELLSPQEAAAIYFKWSASKKLDSSQDGGFPLKEILEIINGRQTDVFKTADEKRKDISELETRSFSLRTNDRTLDLEFPDAGTCRQFKAALEYILAFLQ